VTSLTQKKKKKRITTNLDAGKQHILKLCGLLLMAVQPNKTTIV